MKKLINDPDLQKQQDYVIQNNAPVLRGRIQPAMELLDALATATVEKVRLQPLWRCNRRPTSHSAHEYGCAYFCGNAPGGDFGVAIAYCLPEWVKSPTPFPPLRIYFYDFSRYSSNAINFQQIVTNCAPHLDKWSRPQLTPYGTKGAIWIPIPSHLNGLTINPTLATITDLLVGAYAHAFGVSIKTITT